MIFGIFEGFSLSQEIEEYKEVERRKFTFMSGLIKIEGGALYNGGYLSLSGGFWSPGYMMTKGLWVSTVGADFCMKDKNFAVVPKMSIDYIPFWDFTSCYTRVTLSTSVEKGNVDFILNPQFGITSLAGIAYASLGYQFKLTENTLFESRGLNFSIGLNIPIANTTKIIYMVTFKEPYPSPKKITIEKKHL